MTLAERIPTDAGAFVARFGGVVELSPWVAERAFLDGPFADAMALHEAFHRALHAAERALQLEVLRAHPELAAERVIPRHELTAESRSEQASAGLDRLADERRVALARTLATYRELFGFPFIVCVRDHGSIEVIEELAHERVQRDADLEFLTALHEVSAIARHRILDLVGGHA